MSGRLSIKSKKVVLELFEHQGTTFLVPRLKLGGDSKNRICFEYNCDLIACKNCLLYNKPAFDEYIKERHV
jgi:hypothetical protein